MAVPSATGMTRCEASWGTFAPTTLKSLSGAFSMLTSSTQPTQLVGTLGVLGVAGLWAGWPAIPVALLLVGAFVLYTFFLFERKPR